VTDTHTPARYDSRPDTLFHALRVGELMVEMLQEGMHRSVRHDRSKTEPPELALFDVMTPRLKTLVYGSAEYAASLAELKPALDHHYTHNRHHPEHFGERGVNAMTLIDLVEMIADWKASTERMGGTGDLRKSIQINMDRFGIGQQLADILIATADRFGWIPPAAGETMP
jgi:Family of unknown function (DUF5662)